MSIFDIFGSWWSELNHMGSIHLITSAAAKAVQQCTHPKKNGGHCVRPAVPGFNKCTRHLASDSKKQSTDNKGVYFRGK